MEIIDETIIIRNEMESLRPATVAANYIIMVSITSGNKIHTN